MAPEAAAIYARISSDPLGDHLGVTRQRVDCLAEAKRRGWTVADIYVDDDRSAFSGKPRPEYQRLLQDLRDGLRDAVLIWRLDRLYRQPRELEDFILLCNERGIQLATVTGDVDLSTSQGRLMARTYGAFGAHESEVRSERIRRKHQELAERGRISGGGTRPYGYAADRVTVIREEANVIKEMARRILAQDSLRSVASSLNERGIKTVTGRDWTSHGVRQILLGARISGQREHHGEIVGKAVWPAIITPAQSLRLRALLSDPARRTNRAPRKYLLAGLLRCQNCGHVMVARPREDGRRRYVCPRDPGRSGCGRTFILADEVERWVTEGAIARLDRPRVAASFRRGANHDAATSKVLRNLDRDEHKLLELADAYGKNQLSMPELLVARAPIDARIKANHAALNRQNRTSALDGLYDDPDGVRSAFMKFPIQRQQAILKTLLNQVDVGPAVLGRNRFDEDRVRPAWRV